MAKILCASLPADKLTIDGIVAESYDGDFNCERMFSILLTDFYSSTMSLER